MHLETKTRDRIGATFLFAWNIAALIGIAVKLSRALPHADHVGPLLQCLSLGASAAFFTLQNYFLAVRPPPIARASGAMPRVCALLGVYFPAMLIQLPSSTSDGWQLTSAFVTMLGTVAALYVLVHLGSAFSVFPQARKLVTTGPYRFIRHPLYLFEGISVVGIALGYMQPWALLIAIFTFLAQIPRMTFEENILAATFDNYSIYAALTFRLIPGIY